MRRFRVEIPEPLADRIERLSKKPIAEFTAEVLRDYYDDERRTVIPKRDFALSWHPDVYAAMVKHLGRLSIAQFVRQCVYDDMVKNGERGLTTPPEWKAVRAKNKKKVNRRTKPKSASVAEGRRSVIRAVSMPSDWMERIESKHQHAGRYIKAVVQTELERLIGKDLPVQQGMRGYLSHD